MDITSPGRVDSANKSRAVLHTRAPAAFALIGCICKAPGEYARGWEPRGHIAPEFRARPIKPVQIEPLYLPRKQSNPCTLRYIHCGLFSFPHRLSRGGGGGIIPTTLWRKISESKATRPDDADYFRELDRSVLQLQPACTFAYNTRRRNDCLPLARNTLTCIAWLVAVRPKFASCTGSRGARWR